jgi:hypothetical protein
MTPAVEPLAVTASATRMPLPADVSTATLRLAEIDVPPAMLAYHATRTVELAKTIRAGQPNAPLTVVERNGRFVLIGGNDEFAA